MSAENQIDRWTTILDQLEREIGVALAGGQSPSGWQIPDDPGPVPQALRERAAQVLDAQRESLQILATTQLDAARHLSALRAVPDVAPSGRPHYLDVTG